MTVSPIAARAAQTRQPTQPEASTPGIRRLVFGLGPYVLLGLALLPSLTWIASDERVWPWDQAWYGQVSVELFYSLVHSPSEWPLAMGRAFGIKAPGVAWFGQWFVPLGGIGGFDRVLLLSILITQFVSLGVVFQALTSLCRRHRGVAIVSALLVAAGPLFVGLTHQYLVEPLQMLAVAWFVFLMARAPSLHPVELLLHLVAATGLAMLAKVTSPLYCLGPGAVVLHEIYRGYRRSRATARFVWHVRRIPVALVAVAAFGFGVGALGWYRANFEAVASFASLSYSSPMAAFYGAHDVFSAKLAYWLGALRNNFAYPWVAWAALPLLVLAIARRLALVRSDRLDTASRLDLCLGVAMFEIVLILAAFSVGDNQENRYLLPLAPYLALVLAWTLVQIRSQWVTAAAAAIVLGQAVLVNAQALELTPVSSDVAVWLYPTRRDPTRARELDALVDNLCTDSSKLRYTIVGVEEPWFNANTMAYVSAKRHEPQGVRCYFTSLGYAESDTDRAWARVLDLRALYYATLDPGERLSSPQELNQVSTPVLHRLETSGEFLPVAVTSDPAVLVFKRHEP